MTWSPLATLVTPRPTSTTMPAPSWPRIAGNKPSGSAPERVNSSVWQMPVALISISTSPAFGPCSCTVSMVKGAPALGAIAARTSIWRSIQLSMHILLDSRLDTQPMHLPVEGVAADAELARDEAQVPALELQFPEQRVALRPSERVERNTLRRRCGRLRGRCADTVVLGQVRQPEPVARAPRDHGAQRVAQLPYVSWPLTRA